MKNFFKKVGAFLRKTWVWTLLLVLLAALLVWFVGPLLAVADYKFWESPTSRLLSISLMFLVWGLAMVFVSWRAGVRRKAVEDSDEGQERLRRDGLIEDEQKELRSRFKDALRTLKTSSLYRGRSERWRNELPWYLLIGPQGSGKTSLLDFSGLEFPINRIDRKLTRDTAGTRYCDWYFADHGVLIDTAGRYLTQADGEVDGGAWATLLGLLRKRRRARPLNGVMVSIPVETLLSDDEMALDTLARQVRARLQEIQQTLHLDLPVYLVLSKADQLLGFDEFFDQLSREESDQVLGTSFGKEQNGTDVTVLRQAFEDLLRRLNSQVIMRIHQERDTLRRGRILDFPHQLGQIGERLCLFVELAFTGNRFEFRAVGSEANCASAMIALNSALAEQLVEFKKDVDELIEKGEPKISAILEVIRRYIKVCKPIHFDGNGYSDEWKAEAARRGLDCETSVPVIFDNYLKPESIRMFESIGVMTKKELEARNEVKWEMYTKKIQIEARVLGDLAMNHIIPVATQYQSDLIDNVYKMKDLFSAEKAAKLSAKNLELIEEIADRTAFIKEHVDAMIEARKVANRIESEREKAIAYHDNIVPMMEEIRYHIDKLELIVDNQMWTLPKYRELLFIR